MMAGCHDLQWMLAAVDIASIPALSISIPAFQHQVPIPKPAVCGL